MAELEGMKEGGLGDKVRELDGVEIRQQLEGHTKKLNFILNVIGCLSLYDFNQESDSMWCTHLRLFQQWHGEWRWHGVLH